ncbi:hypothetical protein C1I98_07600 [Spongiactinospora gelatinilytica]|uniref:Uncharacterized protein n=1 Tax=Spongiactinospora gelatinilytica TaxID=2666298 RepID=A0A2W2HNP9_9ACTN|nr:hypothetical protein [Spongiactinospora gelatinilytica]PZG52080.1 hypothetical protein C1I98_07600 [Spongiactinospora gelatinilytica]
MEHVVAAAGALIGGTVVSVVTSGEGALGFVSLVVVPGLLIALFVVPWLSAARPGGPRRAGLWAAVVLGGGSLLPAVIAPKFALLPVFIAALYLTIAGPPALSGACVAAIAAVRSMCPRRMWARWSWTWLLGAVATYGYGLTHFNDGMLDVKDGVCRVTPSGERVTSRGTQTLLPLGDTSCGADTVPGFVNPLLAVLAVLLAVSATGCITARVRTERRRPSIPPPTNR